MLEEMQKGKICMFERQTDSSEYWIASVAHKQRKERDLLFCQPMVASNMSVDSPHLRMTAFLLLFYIVSQFFIGNRIVDIMICLYCFSAPTRFLPAVKPGVVSVLMQSDRYSPSANSRLTATCSFNINLCVLYNITGKVEKKRIPLKLLWELFWTDMRRCSYHGAVHFADMSDCGRRLSFHPDTIFAEALSVGTGRPFDIYLTP